jgi:hypothetical protein
VPETTFERSVFINCPFDEDYAPILQAILFCIVYLELHPRLALESLNSTKIRIDKIQNLIENSKYSIHDLSRCQAKRRGEFYRLNMPFELGIDYACQRYFGNGREDKKILILEERKYRYQAAISDLSGCDIETHGGDYERAVRGVRNWLAMESDLTKPLPAAKRILGAYVDFQGWHYEQQLAAGFSEEDIKSYPTPELLESMRRWISLGRPL